VEEIPVDCCRLVPTAEQAREAPRASLRLAFCERCGFVQNDAFDPARVDYTAAYEDSQAFSPRFLAFAAALAERLVETYGLHGRHVVELGCGKGDFLALLCERSGGSGLGIDPAWQPGRLASPALARLRFRREFWRGEPEALRADLVCCRHTLEHLREPRVFLEQVRAALADAPGCVLFLEVPDVARVLEEGAFWDLYYEHCSYFSLGSLARLLRRCDFEPLRLAAEYGEQYLLADARPASGAAGGPFAGEDDLERLARGVERFAVRLPRLREAWRARLASLRAQGRRAVLWGAGSKAVGFLSTLGITDDVELVVDINPHKQGMYLSGTGQRIAAPEDLVGYRPDVVVPMNPIYRDEIAARLRQLGVAAPVLDLAEMGPAGA
jgi:SAM-dependent methyltransferase